MTITITKKTKTEGPGEAIPTAAEARALIEQAGPPKFEETTLHEAVRLHIQKAIADRVHEARLYVGRLPKAHVEGAIAWLTAEPRLYGAELDGTGHLVIDLNPAAKVEAPEAEPAADVG